MPFYEWNERMSVNIPSVDRQHQVLIGYINNLHDAIVKGNSLFVASSIISKLKNYTRVHFVYEELLFDQHGYEETSEHKMQHTKFISKLDQLKEMCKNKDADVNDKLLEFLKNWLNDHILVEDMSYSKFLLEKGVQ